MPQIILKINSADDRIITDDNICCYIAASDLPAAVISKLISIGKMVLAYGDNALEFCRNHKLDGVFIKVDTSRPIKSQLKPLREALKGKTLGALIPPRRHEAMLTSEVEPEVVAFDMSDGIPHNEIISWYEELFLLPCALYYEQAPADISSIKSDFVIINAQKNKDSGC